MSNLMKILLKIPYLPFCYLVINLFCSSFAVSQAGVESNTVLVEPGDSLFRIAMENRPNETVSLQQTMVAIQRLNPNAFVDGNINRVKSGELLLIPSINQISGIDLIDAISLIRQQNQILRNNISSNLQINERQGDGQLSILRADDDSPGMPEELLPLELENSELDQRLTELENLIAINLEERDRARLRREELNTRLSQLNDQIDDAKELIRLQDLQLAQLRAQIAQTPLSSTETEAPSLRESANITEDFLKSESGWGRVRDNFFGFFQTNSPLVTVAAPLALLLLGWLLWWDRANYAKSRSSEVAQKSNKFQSQGVKPAVDVESEEAGLEVGFEPANERIQGKLSREGPELSPIQLDSGHQQAEDESIDFIGSSADDDSFADLDFLSDEERKELDTPEAIEEIFYLGDEESATKLELAYAYVKMNDLEGAREILSEVTKEGNADQIKEAEKLLRRMDSIA